MERTATAPVLVRGSAILLAEEEEVFVGFLFVDFVVVVVALGEGSMSIDSVAGSASTSVPLSDIVLGWTSDYYLGFVCC